MACDGYRRGRRLGWLLCLCLAMSLELAYVPSFRRRHLATLGTVVPLVPQPAIARAPRSFEEVIAESGLEDWSVKDYEAMRDDVPRTSKFEAAIRRRLAQQPQATVLDIGTGPFALLAVIAAKAGAKKVYAIEKNPEAAAMAKETVERDGWKDVIEIIQGDSMKVELPEQVDLVVSELIGSIATQEGVEPIIRDARRRFLKESNGSQGGSCGMIPARCQTCIVPVLYKGRSFLQRFTAPFDGVRSRGKSTEGSTPPLRIKSADEGNLDFLAEPQVLEDFDYCAAANSPKQQKSTLEFPIKEEGTWSGFAMWTRVVVDDQDVIEVRGQPDSHWAYVVALMTRSPVSVDPGVIRLVSEIDYAASPVSYSFTAEADINYAYRQLSRALHPDKNPDIPEAHDAFKRLTDASAELKDGLEEQRRVLQAICLAMGTMVTPEMMERPQEALFAEATKMLHAVLALTGEGEVPGPALSRSLAAFTASTAWTNCRPQVLLSEWFDNNRLLDLFASMPLRTCYDCAPKRYRAQFLCALNRATMAEAKRNNDCVRGNWHSVMMQYPEMGLWRDLRDKIKLRVWTPDAPTEQGTKRRGSMWDDEEGKRTSSWAATWRERIRKNLPRGIDSFVGAGDKEVRLMSVALWQDITEWVKTDAQGPRFLSLFTAEPPVAPDGTEAPLVDEWAFVPATDIFLVVGEGIVGVTAEGIGADAKPGHDRMTFDEAMAVERKKKDKDKDAKDKDRGKGDKDRSESRDERRKRDKDGKPSNDPDFNWEKVWRDRVNLSKTRPRNRSPSNPRRGSSRWPPPRRSVGRRRSNRSRSRSRRDRQDRSRERRRRITPSRSLSR
eukprot:symbB.v1.2.003267.t1/scaffold117.1/size318901/6